MLGNMKILVASSGSTQECDEPVMAAESFPWPAGSEIHILSVSEPLYPVPIGMIPDVMDPGEVQVPTQEEAASTALLAANRLRSRGIDAKGISLQGSPDTEITEYAKKWGADLIVVGRHERHGIDKLLSSSVSDSVVKHAPCSVLVVKS